MGSIFEKLEYLKETKKQIANAIEDCEVSVPDNTTFYGYADKIHQIHGSYSTNKYTGTRTYSSAKDKTGSIASSTPSHATDGKYDIDTGEQKKFQALIVNELNEDGSAYTMTPAKWRELHEGEACEGFSSVEIDLTGVVADAVYKVKFWKSAAREDSDLLATIDTPALGTAIYDGPMPKQSGKRFVGWDPKPINVTEDMDVIAKFSSETFTYAKTAIQDSWETICENGGKGYPIGSYKDLEFNPFDRSGEVLLKFTSASGAPEVIPIPNEATQSQTIRMVKVYEGEEGTDSTWLSYTNNFFGPTASGVVLGRTSRDIPITLYSDPLKNYKERIIDSKLGWYSSYIRQAFNTVVFDAIKEPAVKKAIRPVVKYRPGHYKIPEGDVWNLIGCSMTNVQTLDLIWIPSMMEVYCKVFAMRGEYNPSGQYGLYTGIGRAPSKGTRYFENMTTAADYPLAYSKITTFGTAEQLGDIAVNATAEDANYNTRGVSLQDWVVDADDPSDYGLDPNKWLTYSSGYAIGFCISATPSGGSSENSNESEEQEGTEGN
jgi:hypothetical protein